MSKTFLKALENYEKEIASKINKKGLTITVSGLSGVGKGTVAEALAKEFGLQKISSGDLFRKIAKERGVSLEELARSSTDDLDNQMERKTLQLTMRGGFVLDGRLTGMAAGSNADCRILIECDMDEKAERVAKRDNLSIGEARKKLEERDSGNSAKYFRIYGTDGMNKKFYDAVINTEKMSMDATKTEAIRIAHKVLKEKKS
ncbi:MAG: nucleoside monophosphate kinase [Candidatus Aenigmatarchaeota archaeon]